MGMGMGSILLIYLVIGLIPGIITGLIASSKGRSFWAWFFCGLIVFIIALPLAIFLKPSKEIVDNKALESGTSKKCPYCFEVIDMQASICRFCHKEQPAPSEVKSWGGNSKCPICKIGEPYIDTYGKWYCPGCKDYIKFTSQ